MKMYCRNCGKEISEGVKFCPHCGAAQTPKEEKEVIVENSKEQQSKITTDTPDKPEEESDTSSTHKKTKISFNPFDFSELNYKAGFLGPIFYFYKGLWEKGILILSADLLLVSILSFFTHSIETLLVIGAAMYFVFYGYLANNDLRAKENNNETMWKELPYVFSNKVVPIGITVAVVFLLSFSVGNAYTANIEDSARPIVSQVLSKSFELDYDCSDVAITRNNGNNQYDAIATVDGGQVINVSIQVLPKKNSIVVTIPYSEAARLN